MSKAFVFLQRALTSTALIAIAIGIIFFGNVLAFSIIVTIFIALSLNEFFTLLQKAEIPVSPLFGLMMGVSIPIVVYLESGATQSGEVLFLVIGCLFLFILKFFRKSDPQALVGISLTLFGILYISWFCSFMIKLRFLEGGIIWVAYLLAVTKAADIGAYCIGSLIGKHPLIPHVSPKKSVEGIIGGILTSMAVSYFFGPYLPLPFSLGHLLLLGLLIAVVGQIGDLSESMMKRFCHTKDSGHLLPGMGGVLDAVDSVIFTAPIFYFHLKIFL